MPNILHPPANATYRHFKLSEFTCKCGCGTNLMDHNFICLLDDIRDRTTTPFIITSGYRCKVWDKHYNGHGNHPSGLAADISALSGDVKMEIVKLAILAGIRRIGVGSSFIHLDIMDQFRLRKEALWLY